VIFSHSKNLVVVTKKFGKNFSGATLATQQLLFRWAKSFDKIIVLTSEIGDYINFPNLELINIQRNMRLPFLKKLNGFVGYSDDHTGFIFKYSKIPYIHTYHGNWPDARWINFNYFIKSFAFIFLYGKVIKNARKVVNVSYYMEKFTNKYNTNSVVIRNGVEVSKILKNSNKTDNNLSRNFLMVGSIDNRKYSKSISIFKRLKKFPQSIKIDIYGKKSYYFAKKKNNH
jgi:glycosyltransferase involved in cell wall biosynthesis